MRQIAPSSRSRFRPRLAAFDALWAVVAPPLALALRDPALLAPGGAPDGSSAPFLFALCATAASLVTFALFRLADRAGQIIHGEDVLAISAASATAVAAATFTLFTLNRLEGVPRSTPLILMLVLTGGLALGRALRRKLRERRLVAEPPDGRLRNFLVVGADRFSALAIQLVASQSPPTARVIGVLDERRALTGRNFAGAPVLGSAHDLEPVLEEYAVHGVTIDRVLVSSVVETLSNEAVAAMRRVCQRRGVVMQTLAEGLGLAPPDGGGEAAPSPPPMATKSAAPSRFFRVKRIIDVAGAAALLVALAPVAGVVALVTLLDVGRPLLFWQERVGRHGGRFLLFKFRTLRAPFDRHGRIVGAADRVTAVGRFLRSTRLDEIPQLWNVLAGDMSLIGPRPLLPRDQPADPSRRLSVRPGITGWAQVHGGALVSAEQKEALDAWYVEHASLAIDARIAGKTLLHLLRGERLDSQGIGAALDWRRAGDASRGTG